MTRGHVKVSLLDLTLATANTVDLVSTTLHNHHKQVAYIAYRLRKEINSSIDNQNKLLIAGLLRDIGGFQYSSLQCYFESKE